MEYKESPFFIKAIEDRTITGIASVFGNLDSYNDIVHRGSFKKTIKEGMGRVRHLWMHDPWQPPTAAIKSLREVGREELPAEVQEKFPTATGGLEIARQYLRTPRGDEILEGIKEQAILEMSFGFDALKFDFEEVKEGDYKGVVVRNVREVRLWDTSDVNWGANQATVASKSALDAHINQLIAYAETLTKAGRVLSARNLEKLKGALAVLNEILNAAEPPADEEDTESGKALTEQVLQRLAIAERELFLIQ
jgi:uncharacterized protein